MRMNFFAFALVLLFSGFSQAAALELLPTFEPGISVVWEYDGVIPYPGNSDPFEFRVTMTPIVSPTNYKQMRWNLRNTQDQTLLLSNWKSFPADTKSSFVLSLAQDVSLLKLLPHLQAYQIVISPNESDIAYFISLDHLYQLYPKSFQDLTNPSSQLCGAEESKLPDIVKECTEWRDELSDYPCVSAKRIFEEAKICGPYSCQSEVPQLRYQWQ